LPLGVVSVAMFPRIALELLLAVGVLFIGLTFWQIQKRATFLKRAICNPEFLQSVISLKALSNPPALVAFFAKKREMGYVSNISIAVEADRLAQRRPKMISVACLLCVLTCSYFLGVSYLAINGVLFLLLSINPLCLSGRENALEQILTIAVILYRWRGENPAECEAWIERAWALRPVYEAVKAASSTCANSSEVDGR